MNDSSLLSKGRSRTSALGLLEKARELARQDRPTSSDGAIESTTLGGGDKGDKWGKPPSEHTHAPVPDIVLTTDDPEVAWRARVMCSEIRPGFPIPLLVARDVPVVEGACLSCGVPLAEEERYRCLTCLKAAILVLATRQK